MVSIHPSVGQTATIIILPACHRHGSPAQDCSRIKLFLHISGGALLWIALGRGPVCSVCAPCLARLQNNQFKTLQTSKHTWMRAETRMHTYIHTHTYIYTCIYTYIHAYMHTCINSQREEAGVCPSSPQ